MHGVCLHGNLGGINQHRSQQSQAGKEPWECPTAMQLAVAAPRGLGIAWTAQGSGTGVRVLLQWGFDDHSGGVDSEGSYLLVC